ncbi:MAG: aromatic ring-hydroxylating dioxygenase subunit alpha [Proteobacteria bacterium]|nr:aromatic ring-hydroxylating dioxygenase subunit alpha [Pseudomonadota bacterium]
MNSPLAAVPASGLSARYALPAWVYDHPQMTRLEYERLLLPSWQIVCHVSELARPGDYHTLDLGRDSVIVLRNSRGGIDAFHNSCRHRGARLLEGAGHCPGIITCPYHGWSYRLSGELQSVTARNTFGSLDRAALGLHPVRTDVVFGFVFVCLVGDPPRLGEVWADVAAELAPHRIDEMQLLSSYVEHWECDWKVAMDNYLESYHVPIGHPGLYRLSRPDYEDQRKLPGGLARGIGWLREQPSTRWSERAYQGLLARLPIEHLPEEHRRRWSFYSQIPNLGIDIFPDQMDFFQVLPNGTGRCTVRGACYGLPDSRREMRVLRYLNARINREVQREDRQLCRRVQLGLASGAYRPGPLSSLEDCMAVFHDLLRERIPEARLPAAPAHFAPVAPAPQGRV